MLGQFDVGRVELGYGYVSRRLGDVQVIGAVPDVEVVSLRDDDAVELVMAAGRDPAAYLDTSLPRKPSRWAARHWMRTFPQTAWLAYVDGSPAALERPARSRRRLSGTGRRDVGHERVGTPQAAAVGVHPAVARLVPVEGVRGCVGLVSGLDEADPVRRAVNGPAALSAAGRYRCPVQFNGCSP